MSLFKKLKIFRLFLFSKIGQEIVFGDILEKKKFLDYKKKEFKNLKTGVFSNGLVTKLKILNPFRFGTISQRNVSADILERNKLF